MNHKQNSIDNCRWIKKRPMTLLHCVAQNNKKYSTKYLFQKQNEVYDDHLQQNVILNSLSCFAKLSG